MKPHIHYQKRDDYSTPKEAFEFIFKHIPRDKLVYDPFYCEGDSGKYMKELGIECIHENIDFFNNNIHFDMIVTNPPYSIKKKIIDYCLSLKKPFALLLPVETIERLYLHGVDYTLLIPKKRYAFKQGKSTPPFKTCWFCFGFNMKQQIIFE